MTQFQPIEVKDLQNTSTLSNTAQLLALTDATNNTVNLINKTNLISTLISSTGNNLLTSDSNGLLVNNIIGLLSNLDTTTKTNIVSAINELVVSINDVYSPPVTTLGTSGTLSLTDNSTNKTKPTAAISFSLPTSLSASKYHQILVQIDLTSTSYISGDNLGTTHFFNQKKPTFSSTGQYDVIYEYDSTISAWTVGAIFKGVVS